MAETDVRTPTTPQRPTGRVDGRTARRERGRIAVMDAMVDLVREGHAPPTAEAVAERAGVSISSLFRYFENLDDLREQTASRFFERYADRFDVPGLGEGALDERVAGFVAARVDLYEAIGPVARLARTRILEHPELTDTFRVVRFGFVDQVRAHFAPELSTLGRAARDDMTGSLMTLTSLDAWDLLHRDLGRSPRQIRRAWTDAIHALLAAD